ncbi:hypothetical protein Pint_30745 [Pistacia integerrima]|uniref:Uncharacterized protein n=1 Tax=Pistacia integerrima TaxID=434235 RepID=A0ACC0X242_9ROSI|nr:hypothetical protein Pint_30745 [Pistacia integerrima]
MGTIISKTANGVGGVFGNAFSAPCKAIFGRSYEGVCSGPWDIVCFIEHFCIANLVKLLMIFGLCYIILWFCDLLFNLGICQCIIRSLCKMCCAACETYWYALEDITCFLWQKLMNTKRRNRHGRIRDVELGYSSSDESDFSSECHHFSSSRKCYRERKQWYGNGSRRHHHHVKLKTREVSVHVKAGIKKTKKFKAVSNF